MLSTLAKAAPRLLQASSKFNHLPALYQSTNVKAKVIESEFKPSGHVPNDETYFQIPTVLDGVEYISDPALYQRPHPMVPTLDEISLERQLEKQKEDAEKQAGEEEVDDELAPKTLEDKLRVWFGEDMPTKYDDQRPERDLVNYPRIPPIPTHMPPTRMYFVPESWLKFFETKTGRTGGYVFGATFLSFLLQKEILCYNENAHIVTSLSLIAIIGGKMFGKQLSGWMRSDYIKMRQGWIDWQDGCVKLLKSHVKELKQIEERSVNPELIYDAKREILSLQQEAEYRRRLMAVYNEVKRKLDYQVAIEDAKKNFTRRHLVNWVIENVNKNVNADLEKAVLRQCVTDLKTLSEKRRNAI